jgi:hypothetical protein
VLTDESGLLEAELREAVMANLQGHIGLTVVDGLGTKATTEFYIVLDDSKTLADAVADAQALCAAVDATLDAKVESARVTVNYQPTGMKSVPTSGSRVEQTGVINFSNDTTARKQAIVLPGLKNAAIVAGKMNLADTAIAALIAFIKSAGTSGTWANFAFQTLVDVLDAILSFRKHRKSLSRTSYEI